MGYRFYCCMILMNLCLLGWNETFYGDISNHYGDNNEIIMGFFTNHRQWGASKPFCWGHRNGYSTYLLGDIRRYLNGPWNELLTVVVCKWMICNRNPHFKMQTNDSWKYGENTILKNLCPSLWELTLLGHVWAGWAFEFGSLWGGIQEPFKDGSKCIVTP